MNKKSLFIFLLISIVLALFSSFVYISNIRTIVETKARANISDTTTEVTDFLDNYIDSAYKEMELYSSNYTESIKSEKFLNDCYNRYKDQGFVGFGAYTTNNNAHSLDLYTGEFHYNHFSLSTERLFKSDASICKLSSLFDYVYEGQDKTVILYRFAEFFALQSFDSISRMIDNIYSDGVVNIAISDKNGYVFVNTLNDRLNLYSVFGKKEITSTEDLVNEVNSYASESKLMTINNERYLVACSSTDNSYFANGLIIFVFVSSNYLTTFSSNILNTTIVYVIFFIVAILACGFFVFLNNRSSKDILIPFTYNKHYVVLLGPSGRVISKNPAFAKSKFNCNNFMEKVIGELTNQTSAALAELLDNSPILTLIDQVKDIEGTVVKESFVTFLVIKTNIGYQLIGHDNGTTTNGSSKFVGNIDVNPTSIAEAQENEIVKQIAYYDDVYQGYLNKKRLFKDIDDMLEGKTQLNKNLYLIYSGLVNRNEIIKVFGHSTNEMINHSYMQLLKKYAYREKIYVISDDYFAFFMEFNDDFNDLLKKFKPLENESERPIKVVSDEIVIEPNFGIYPLKLIEKDVYATSKACLDHAIVAYEIAVDSPNKRYLFDINSAQLTSKAIQIARDIENGIKRNEFITNYQPIFSIRDDRVTCFECLLRWDNDKYRYESPFEYIKIAEQNGYIHDIGRITFEQTLKLLKTIKDDEVRISVNVSPAQFLQAGFCHDLVEMIKSSGVPFRQVGIEVTETFFIQSLKDVIEKLNLLRSYGMKVYLDDFGTGYSSLLYLAELPVDVIKIDKEFTKQIETNAGVRTIISHLSGIAHDLDIDLVAEGVETMAQYNFLNKNGINYIQGFILAKPVASNVVIRSLDYRIGDEK